MEEFFEFDLSDVDVAAFENVASTPPQSTSPTPQLTSSIPEAPTIPSDGKDLSTTEETIETTTTITATRTETNNTVTLAHLTASAAPSEPVTLTTTTASPTITTLATSQQHGLTAHLQQHHQQQHQHHIHINQQQQQQQLQHHVSHLTTGPQSCKILLIPINSTNQGTQGIKHLIQLPPGASPMTVNALKNASGNKKQVLQFAPKNDNIFHQQPQRPATPTPQMIANEVPKRKPCNCTKSQCLKLYCDCFANGEFCSGCNCTNCFNSLSKEKERQKAITQCLERNPEAFRPKIGKAIKSSQGEPVPESIERRHTKGCNCKRSGCLKNYCECYEAKILCSNLCKCCGCKNYEESFERKTLMQLANSSSESARGILKNLLPTNNGALGGKEFTKSFITDSVIRASLQCLLQSAQQAEKDGLPADKIQNLIQVEMGKCLRMIVDSASESSSAKKR